jgi:Chaperone of endosialidase
MDKASESILALKPVSFRYKVHRDATPQFALIAEQVAEVNPDLVVFDKNGEIYTVRYDQVNAMLLNEFLKARRQIDLQQKQIDALAAGLQKVSAQLEVSKPALQTVLNN